MSMLFDPLKSVTLADLEKVTPGDLFLLPEQSETLVGLRLIIPHITNSFPAVIFKSGQPPTCVPFQPAFATHCLVLGKAVWRIPASISSFAPKSEDDKPGVVFTTMNNGAYLCAQIDRGGTTHVNLATNTTTKVVAPKWCATQWQLGITDAKGEFSAFWDSKK